MASTKRIVDEFTALPVSRQRKHQLRRKRAGNCVQCGKPREVGRENTCVECERDRYRRRIAVRASLPDRSAELGASE